MYNVSTYLNVFKQYGVVTRLVNMSNDGGMHQKYTNRIRNITINILTCEFCEIIRVKPFPNSMHVIICQPKPPVIGCTMQKRHIVNKHERQIDRERQREGRERGKREREREREKEREIEGERERE